MWGETLEFNYVEGVEEIFFKVFDKETFKSDDLIGQSTSTIREILHNGELTLNFEGEKAGDIILTAAMKE